MLNDPVLAERKFKDKHDGSCVMTVYGGLHYIRGNRQPYFSLTSWTRTVLGRDIGGGANHEEILRHFPQFKDLAKLHLSDIDGTPMHAAANALYWLDGAMSGVLGTEYHGGNGSVQKTPYECYQIFREHLRVGHDQYVYLNKVINGLRELYLSDGPKTTLRAVTKELEFFVEMQKPRWKKEADACIANHKLVVYGDPYVVT